MKQKVYVYEVTSQRRERVYARTDDEAIEKLLGSIEAYEEYELYDIEDAGDERAGD